MTNLGKFRASSMNTFKTEFTFFWTTFAFDVNVDVVVSSVAVDLFDVGFDVVSFDDDDVEMIEV